MNGWMDGWMDGKVIGLVCARQARCEGNKKEGRERGGQDAYFDEMLPFMSMYTSVVESSYFSTQLTSSYQSLWERKISVRWSVFIGPCIDLRDEA